MFFLTFKKMWRLENFNYVACICGSHFISSGWCCSRLFVWFIVCSLMQFISCHHLDSELLEKQARSQTPFSPLAQRSFADVENLGGVVFPRAF